MIVALKTVTPFLVIALGVIHIALTPVFYKQLTLQAMWYTGSGLALVLLGFINVAYFRQAGQDTLLQTMCIFSNAISVIFMAVLAFINRQPQVFLGLGLLSVQTVMVFLI